MCVCARTVHCAGSRTLILPLPSPACTRLYSSPHSAEQNNCLSVADASVGSRDNARPKQSISQDERSLINIILLA